ncbi:tRNA uridine-5-carboxymethylaminomethyl(34) synthesis GTPase MnmE [Roseomonas sp. CCTCC AB2023176]|uniref:tRNA uridine-5-carboxymethylaminomethyl(34) synthesis GTPase MnmE n=1 Tax=Roseomonas sp. CCTCC AB2023176 TaxID=3342640 RepID=UPI0035DE32AC
MTLDTIVALATPSGRGALAVVRISGPGSRSILTSVAGRLPSPRVASLRRLRGADGDILDEALILWFPGPHSYTGEDVAEFHLHGGTAVVGAVLDRLADLGARPAEPGEFTRQAVLNGRMDLTAAESVVDLIDAETAAQARQALRNLGGALARQCDAWATRLTGLLARAEAAIEFAEDGTPEASEDSGGAASLAAEIRTQLAADQGGERIRTGLDIAILGAPNAGKSSLINALAGREAAIVSAQPGTTRDVVEARIVLAGLPITLADTAGLRETVEEIEREGIRRALDRGEAADIVVAVLACDAPADDATLALIARRHCIVVGGKADLAPPPSAWRALPVSVRTGQGLRELRDRIEAEAQALTPSAGAALLTRPRHRAALRDTADWLDEASIAPLPELRAEALRAALDALGRLTGRVGAEDVLDRLFADFCVGK